MEKHHAKKKGLEVEAYNRDIEYWNTYYSTKKLGFENQSLFAEFVIQDLEAEKSLLELGCGNGRDSLYFAKNGIYVTAIDASDKAISLLNTHFRLRTAQFICGDFVESEEIYQKQYDYCYSRFTWHSITQEQETNLLYNLPRAIKSNGRLFIEARSIHDDIFGEGCNVGENAYIYNDHFRRFIDMHQLTEKLVRFGFSIKSAQEGRGFAPYKEEDPVLIRIEAIKG